MIRHLLLGASALALASAVNAQGFDRIASFPVTSNLPEGTDPATETAPEIIAASGDTLVYTDSPLGALGFIDISDPARPQPLGAMMLEGEPTSVATAGGHALVGVNTSESYTDPSGYLAGIEIATRTEVGRCDLPGQPDSVAIAPDASFLAVAIENERDEDLNDGVLPQMPAGSVFMVDLTAEGLIDCETARVADVTGLAEVAPSDPEPEYVSINAEGEVVVTLQENNHIVVLSRTGEVRSHFPAGAVDLTGIDATDADGAARGALRFEEDQPGRLREPDAVAWIDADHFATANEGDYEGGARGWTIFNQDGTVVYENGSAFERAIAEIGHYPDRRSDAKGVEPESVAFAEVAGTPMVFVGAERASVVGVYDVTDPAAPVLTQLLPSGVGPEGYAVLADRGLLVTANEGDLGEDGGARAHVMIYEYADDAPVYPHLTSAGSDELIGWGAMSGLVAEGGLLYAVNDSFYGDQPRIFTIDPSGTPARITGHVDVTRGGNPAQKLDLEGIATDGQGGFWLASEGRSDRLIPHALLHVGPDGEIGEEIALPEALRDVELRFGMEGVTRDGDMLYIAIQRPWRDDPANHVKLLRYDLAAEEWGVVHYPTEPAATGWVGLSEIVAHDGALYLIERDNLIGEAARLKQITRVSLDGLDFVPLGETPPVATKEVVRDLLPDLRATGGYVVDKVEGLAITPEGTAYVVTDNDGVDDSSGETLFFSFDLN
ncbi:esterase-like activity of phytase family protein [Jannaschia formosa]|uniref:esterase-like activity of phytase family protein n=1 Tax=Jannaschia formosa TaxID=2259592 RepID=UPI000E1BDAC7|nr:esterase-like activity of phytase family protein [Jannaschia formosa]TFL19734.1 esterase-like activity of phytase family protein [Jannaschia formosa]